MVLCCVVLCCVVFCCGGVLWCCVVVFCMHDVLSYLSYNTYRRLVRFATSKFDLKQQNDLFRHLTNSSINKDSSTLNTDKGIVGKGCKWRLKKLLDYLRSVGADTQRMWNQIKTVVMLTLLPMVRDETRHHTHHITCIHHHIHDMT